MGNNNYVTIGQNCHRCGLTNEDLNRRWICPDEKLHPEIYHTKGLLDFSNRALQRLPAVFIDFHGHSRKKNIFMYGCSGAESWNSGDRAAAAATLAAASQPQASAENIGANAGPYDHKVLPELMGKFAPAFSLSSCSFRVERCRESTARVTVWREFGIRCSYTLEASYCGCDQGRYQGYHLSAAHLKEVGSNLCQALAVLREELYLHRTLAADCEPSSQAGASGPTAAPTAAEAAKTATLTPSTSTTSFTTCSTASRVSPANSNVIVRRRPAVVYAGDSRR